MRYPCTLTTSTGEVIKCTDPQRPPVIAGDRFSLRPTAGSVLTSDDGSHYLLLEVEAVRRRDVVHYYKLGIIELKHTIELQRISGDNFTTYATIPGHLHNSTTTEEHSQDRSRSVARLDIWSQPMPEVESNDRLILGTQPYRVIGTEHLQTISRLIVTTDYR